MCAADKRKSTVPETRETLIDREMIHAGLVHTDMGHTVVVAALVSKHSVTK
jgi:hypothetical protein